MVDPRGCEDSIAPVRPEVTDAPPRYRNDAVYRSAERLIAADSRKPVSKRSRRLIFFLAGLTCGFGGAFLLFKSPEEPARVAPSAKAANDNATNPRKRGANVLPAAKSAGDTAPANAAVEAGEPSAPVKTAGVPTAPAPASLIPARPLPMRSPPAPAAAPSETPLAWLVAASSSLSFKLSGEIRFPPAAPPIKLEMQLYVSRIVDGGSLSGTVLFLDDPSFKGMINVRGIWIDHDITLNEIQVLPQGAGYSYPPPGHLFDFHLPESGDSGDLTGTWNHGGLSGKLVLKVVPPFNTRKSK